MAIVTDREMGDRHEHRSGVDWGTRAEAERPALVTGPRKAVYPGSSTQRAWFHRERVGSKAASRDGVRALHRGIDPQKPRLSRPA